MRIPGHIILALILTTIPLHAEETADPVEFSQEEYNRRVKAEMEEVNQALQAMSKFMVQSMNNMTGAINESLPGITQSMGELLKSMQPIIKAAQENQQLGNELNRRPTPEAGNTPATPQPAAPVFSSDLPDIPQPKQEAVTQPVKPTLPKTDTIYKPKRIQLFPAPQPNY